MNDPHDLLLAGRTDDALAIFAQQFADATDNESIYLAAMGVATCHARKRRWIPAQSELEHIVERFPERAEARAYLGSVLVEQGNVDDGLEHLVAAEQLEPDNALAIVKQAEALNRVGRIHDALDAFRRAARTDNIEPSLQVYIRTSIQQLQKSLAGSIERVPVAPRTLWHRMRGSTPPSSETVPDLQPVVAPDMLNWNSQ